MSLFKKATRKKVFVKIAVTGPSGSGKTMSSLRLARGLVGPSGKIAVIDTENDSASLYAGQKPGREVIEFDSAVMSAPFTVEKYIRALDEAELAGYDCVVIDSLSHAWAADGGLLQKKEALDARGGNSFSNWSSITKEHERLKAKLLQSRVHVIACMRSKQDYVLESNDKGKQTPRKVGLAPIQRDGMEYEFSVVFDVAMDHSGTSQPISRTQRPS